MEQYYFYASCIIEEKARTDSSGNPGRHRFYTRIAVPLNLLLDVQQEQLEKALEDWSQKMLEQSGGVRVILAEYVSEDEYKMAVQMSCDNVMRGLAPPIHQEGSMAAKIYRIYFKATGMFPELANQRGTGKDGPDIPFFEDIARAPKTLTQNDILTMFKSVREMVELKFKRTPKEIKVISEKEYTNLMAALRVATAPEKAAAANDNNTENTQR